ncbi:MAG: HD domain-containing protein [Chlorobi bacterium]|nr:HD domain-containing protein [Chlorobiota bacterium]
MSIPEDWVKDKLSSTDAGHDWWHAVRVRNNAVKIAEKEGGNLKIIETAALIHDLIDDKFFETDNALKQIEVKLKSLSYSEEEIKHIINIITSMSFSKELEGSSFDSPEFRVVQDADRLDAIGAIGIARAFSYGGHKKRAFYDPAVPIDEPVSKEQYRKSTAPTINHFYEKLLKLRNMMKTTTGKEMAQERHIFMEKFLEQFFKEWR